MTKDKVGDQQRVDESERPEVGHDHGEVKSLECSQEDVCVLGGEGWTFVIII